MDLLRHRVVPFNFRKKPVFVKVWEPVSPKAVAVLVHGYGEHIGRYEYFVIPKLLEKNIAVLGYDNLGHGRTIGKRGHCPGYDTLLHLLEQMMDKAQWLYPRIPLFLYGHSMGGNLVLNYALRKPNAISGIIASSPYLKLAFKPPKWKLNTGKVLQKVWPSFTMPAEIDTNTLSRIPDEIIKYKNDALIHGKISPNYAFPVMEAGLWAIDNAADLNTETLLFHGTSDGLIDSEGTRIFAERSIKAELHLIEDGYHELHNDLDADNVLNTARDWIGKRIKS